MPLGPDSLTRVFVLHRSRDGIDRFSTHHASSKHFFSFPPRRLPSRIIFHSTTQFHFPQTLILPCACYLSILKGKVSVFQVRPISHTSRAFSQLFSNLMASFFRVRFAGIDVHSGDRSRRGLIGVRNLFSPLADCPEFELMNVLQCVCFSHIIFISSISSAFYLPNTVVLGIVS